MSFYASSFINILLLKNAFILFLVTEWIGPREGTQDVLIHFMPDRKQLSISLFNKQTLRTIDLKNVKNVELQVGAGGRLHYVLVRIIREYDIVSVASCNHFLKL